MEIVSLQQYLSLQDQQSQQKPVFTSFTTPTANFMRIQDQNCISQKQLPHYQFDPLPKGGGRQVNRNRNKTSLQQSNSNSHIVYFQIPENNKQKDERQRDASIPKSFVSQLEQKTRKTKDLYMDSQAKIDLAKEESFRLVVTKQVPPPTLPPLPHSTLNKSIKKLTDEQYHYYFTVFNTENAKQQKPDGHHSRTKSMTSSPPKMGKLQQINHSPYNQKLINSSLGLSPTIGNKKIQSTKARNLSNSTLRVSTSVDDLGQISNEIIIKIPILPHPSGKISPEIQKQMEQIKSILKSPDTSLNQDQNNTNSTSSSLINKMIYYPHQTIQEVSEEKKPPKVIPKPTKANSKKVDYNAKKDFQRIIHKLKAQLQSYGQFGALSQNLKSAPKDPTLNTNQEQGFNSELKQSAEEPLKNLNQKNLISEIISRLQEQKLTKNVGIVNQFMIIQQGIPERKQEPTLLEKQKTQIEGLNQIDSFCNETNEDQSATQREISMKSTQDLEFVAQEIVELPNETSQDEAEREKVKTSIRELFFHFALKVYRKLQQEKGEQVKQSNSVILSNQVLRKAFLNISLDAYQILKLEGQLKNSGKIFESNKREHEVITPRRSISRLQNESPSEENLETEVQRIHSHKIHYLKSSHRSDCSESAEIMFHKIGIEESKMQIDNGYFDDQVIQEQESSRFIQAHQKVQNNGSFCDLQPIQNSQELGDHEIEVHKYEIQTVDRKVKVPSLNLTRAGTLKDQTGNQSSLPQNVSSEELKIYQFKLGMKERTQYLIKQRQMEKEKIRQDLLRKKLLNQRKQQ